MPLARQEINPPVKTTPPGGDVSLPPPPRSWRYRSLKMKRLPGKLSPCHPLLTAPLVSIITLCAIIAACLGGARDAGAESSPPPAVALNGGMAQYGLLSPHWPCAAAIAADRDLPVLRKAVLWNTFGNDTRCLEQYLADPRLAVLEIHLVNEVCQRHGRCGAYEFLAGMTVKEYNSKLLARDPSLVARLRDYLKAPAHFLETHRRPHTTCFISPGLESNLSKAAAAIVMELVQRYFPACKLVWNPVGGSPHARPIPGTIFEAHGPSPVLSPPCIANLDGVDVSFADRPALVTPAIAVAELEGYFARYARCEAAFIWIAEDNGLMGTRTFIDPRLRRNFPSSATLSRVASTLQSLRVVGQK